LILQKVLILEDLKSSTSSNFCQSFISIHQPSN
jgi:hypothetical protein